MSETGDRALSGFNSRKMPGIRGSVFGQRTRREWIRCLAVLTIFLTTYPAISQQRPSSIGRAQDIRLKYSSVASELKGPVFNVLFQITLTAEDPAENVEFCVEAPSGVLVIGDARSLNTIRELKAMGLDHKSLHSAADKSATTDCWILKHLNKGQKLILQYNGVRTGSPPPNGGNLTGLNIKTSRGFSLKPIYYFLDHHIRFQIPKMLAKALGCKEIVVNGSNEYDFRDSCKSMPSFDYPNGPLKTESGTGQQIAFQQIVGDTGAVLETIPLRGTGAGSCTNISDCAYQSLNQRMAINRCVFFVYKDADSGFNHGFPSLFGNIDLTRINVRKDCVASGVPLTDRSGTKSEVVEVTGETAQVETVNPTLGASVTSRPLVDLSLNGRNVLDLATLEPGGTPHNPDDTSAGMYNIAGARSDSVTFLLDGGVDNNLLNDRIALDATHGTVLRIRFPALPLAQDFASVQLQEPQNFDGQTIIGNGYDLTLATAVQFDVRSLGGAMVQFGVGGCVTNFVQVGEKWTTMTVQLDSLLPESGDPVAACAPDITNTHILFSIAMSGANSHGGGTVLLANIEFTPVPNRQSASALALNLPLSTQTFGVVVPGGATVAPPDQANRNVSSIYESALTILSLLKRGQSSDIATTLEIANALDYALHHDNYGGSIPPVPNGAGSSGLHNGYSAGDITLLNAEVPPGGGKAGDVRLAGFSALPTECMDKTFCEALSGATSGNNAWAILALEGAYLQSGDVIFLDDAETIGNWIIGSFSDRTNQIPFPPDCLTNPPNLNALGYGGYFVGYAHSTLNIICSRSTENNADIFAAFSLLAQIETARGDLSVAQRWSTAANWAGSFVLQTVTTSATSFQGFDLITSVLARGVAWEFTGQMAETCSFLDVLQNSTTFQNCTNTDVSQIEQAQNSAPFGDGLAMVASVLHNGSPLRPVEQCIATPFQCIPERVGLGATAWAALADQQFNAMTYSATNIVPAMSFPGQLVATNSTAQLVTLTNAGSAPLSVTSISMNGDASDFKETDNCTASILRAGTNCTIVVVFAPAAEGDREATLLVSHDGMVQTLISIRGEGVPINVFSFSGIPTSTSIPRGEFPAYAVSIQPFGTAYISCASRIFSDHPIAFWHFLDPPKTVADTAAEVVLDATLPITTAAVSPAPNASGWNNMNVIITLNSTDNEANGTGIKQIVYSVAGAQPVATTIVPGLASIPITVEGLKVNFLNAGGARWTVTSTAAPVPNGPENITACTGTPDQALKVKVLNDGGARLSVGSSVFRPNQP